MARTSFLVSPSKIARNMPIIPKTTLQWQSCFRRSCKYFIVFNLKKMVIKNSFKSLKNGSIIRDCKKNIPFHIIECGCSASDNAFKRCLICTYFSFCSVPIATRIILSSQQKPYVAKIMENTNPSITLWSIGMKITSPCVLLAKEISHLNTSQMRSN